MNAMGGKIIPLRRAQKKSPPTAVEMVGGHGVEPCRPQREGLGSGFAARRQRRVGEQNRAVVEQAVAPSELEEGIDEDRHKRHFQFPNRPEGGNCQGPFGWWPNGVIGRTKRGQQATHQKDLRGGEKDDRIEQFALYRSVQHAYAAAQHHPHPAMVMLGDGRGDRFLRLEGE